MAATDKKSRRIFAVVLAAGSARRFGSTKQLACPRGAVESLVRRASRLAVEVCGERVLLVAGYDAGAVVADGLRGFGFAAINDDHEGGLGNSVACAARSLAHTADAMLLLLADQPRITAEHLAGLCDAWTGDEGHIVATAFGDDVGAPALLPRGTFGRLAGLKGDRGAKAVFGDRDVMLTSLRFDDAAIDIDTPADLASLDQTAE